MSLLFILPDLSSPGQEEVTGDSTTRLSRSPPLSGYNLPKAWGFCAGTSDCMQGKCQHYSRFSQIVNQCFIFLCCVSYLLDAGTEYLLPTILERPVLYWLMALRGFSPSSAGSSVEAACWWGCHRGRLPMSFQNTVVRKQTESKEMTWREEDALSVTAQETCLSPPGPHFVPAVQLWISLWLYQQSTKCSYLLRAPPPSS